MNADIDPDYVALKNRHRLIDEKKDHVRTSDKLGKIQTAAEFIAGFVAPDYLIDDTVQKGRLYSQTGRTGSGKTAVALTMGACVAAGIKFGGRQVESGPVAFFAGENPDDVRARFIMTAEEFGLDPAGIPIYFFEGPFNIVDAAESIENQLKNIGAPALVIVDTAAAFFQGDDENSNVALGGYARDLRRILTQLPGRPCVIVNCHPTKDATAKESMLPRGGGAFLAEVDGNLCVYSADQGETTELHWTGKLRGPGFEPMPFRLARRTSDSVRDAKGRTIPSVVAIAMTESEAQTIEVVVRRDEDAVLDMMLNWPKLSIAAWAEKLGWLSGTNAPQKSRVHRVASRLKADRLAEVKRGRWSLTPAGKKEAEKCL